MSNLDLVLHTLNAYKTEDKEAFFVDCLKARLDRCMERYENSLNEAVKHLSLYRKDVVVLKKYSKGDKDD